MKVGNKTSSLFYFLFRIKPINTRQNIIIKLHAHKFGEIGGSRAEYFSTFECLSCLRNSKWFSNLLTLNITLIKIL